MLFQEPALASSASDFGRCSYAKPNFRYQNNHKLLVKNIFYSNKNSNYLTKTSFFLLFPVYTWISTRVKFPNLIVLGRHQIV